ncbi:MAG TPA: hypothetical protein VKR32_16000 [Puia sp.]|nr:hypothetical protein [Puia sp.]
MKISIKIILFVLPTQLCNAQYYYKDILATKEAVEKQRQYKVSNVRSVDVISTDAEERPEEGFVCRQQVAPDFLETDTYTKSRFNPESYQMTFFDSRGYIIKTVDTSQKYYSTTEYQFDMVGRLLKITNTSTETDNHFNDIEEHLWQYDPSGRPSKLLKVKNGTDTTYFHFVMDDKGDITEEHGVHEGEPLPTIYYYYNNSNQLTDIVRFNAAANRLLPDYIFTYNGHDAVASMVMVPEGSTNYQRWAYQYDDKGLRTEEICFDKQRQILGKIHYSYHFAR